MFFHLITKETYLVLVSEKIRKKGTVHPEFIVISIYIYLVSSHPVSLSGLNNMILLHIRKVPHPYRLGPETLFI